MDVTINGKTINVKTDHRSSLTELVANVNVMVANMEINRALHMIQNGYYCGVYDFYDAAKLKAIIDGRK